MTQGNDLLALYTLLGEIMLLLLSSLSTFYASFRITDIGRWPECHHNPLSVSLYTEALSEHTSPSEGS